MTSAKTEWPACAVCKNPDGIIVSSWHQSPSRHSVSFEFLEVLTPAEAQTLEAWATANPNQEAQVCGTCRNRFHQRIWRYSQKAAGKKRAKPMREFKVPE